MWQTLPDIEGRFNLNLMAVTDEPAIKGQVDGSGGWLMKIPWVVMLGKRLTQRQGRRHTEVPTVGRVSPRCQKRMTCYKYYA